MLHVYLYMCKGQDNSQYISYEMPTLIDISVCKDKVKTHLDVDEKSIAKWKYKNMIVNNDCVIIKFVYL